MWGEPLTSRVLDLAPPPAWVQGGISTEDAAFLGELVAKLEPAHVLELGVAAGTSSAALLYALDQLPPARTLTSVDVRPTCYFDQSRAVGAAVAEMYPRHETCWRLLTSSDARRLGTTLPPGSVDLAFIDANHHHPYPLLDLLHLTPALRPGAWVALHDIALARLYPQFPSHGAEWLFEAWPAETWVSLDSENIGAVRLPADLGGLVPMAQALLAKRWEQAPSREALDLPGVFAALRPRRESN